MEYFEIDLKMFVFEMKKALFMKVGEWFIKKAMLNLANIFSLRLEMVSTRTVLTISFIINLKFYEETRFTN